MSRRIRILCSENRSHAVNSLPTTRNLKLLIELGRLSKVRFLLEIGQLKNIGSSLGSSTNERRGMKLLEAVLLEVFTEEVFDCNPDIGNCLANRCTLVHGGVV